MGGDEEDRASRADRTDFPRPQRTQRPQPQPSATPLPPVPSRGPAYESAYDSAYEPAPVGRQVALIDLLDRLLNGGAVLAGDLVLSIADVDLVHIDLRAVIRSLGPDTPSPWA